ncbi:helix-turn-helix domain-containing protein [Christiangramia sp. LLG6405-1]|uniref:AlbA family DNA-binding domain-containing protein n=1 Tax=Christiangramia sp. LLG6405-1 TaxID=3160832 RepID=UPI0038691927
MQELHSIISELINSKREGVFWDFKEDPHRNKASLLHDILCLANCNYNGDRYLILGVKDPKDNCEIKGLEANKIGRKTQVQLIDFLRAQKFAGDNRPEVEIHTLEINDKIIDVIIILNNPIKPYYIVETYRDQEKKVEANNIYTRTNDTNTPIDKSADIGQIEKMWKERFGLDIPPLQKIKLLLRKPEEWFKDIGNKSYAFNLEFPEFRIEFSELKEFWETYSYFFTNPKSFLGTATFKYHSTTLFELEYITCDEMRIEFSAPSPTTIYLSNSKVYYFHYELESANGAFLEFLTNNLSNLESRGSYFPFIIFRNRQEREDFENYIIKNSKLLDELKPSFSAKHAKKIMESNGKETVMDPIIVDKVIQIHKKWVSA